MWKYRSSYNPIDQYLTASFLSTTISTTVIWTAMHFEGYALSATNIYYNTLLIFVIWPTFEMTLFMMFYTKLSRFHIRSVSKLLFFPLLNYPDLLLSFFFSLMITSQLIHQKSVQTDPLLPETFLLLFVLFGVHALIRYAWLRFLS